MKARWITLGAAAVGAAVIGPQVWTPAATAPVVAPSPAEAVRTEPATDYARLLRRDALAEPTGRAPFASTASQPRAAPRKAVVAPVAETPAPTVPKFPYRWAGRVEVGRALHQAYFMRTNGELVAVLPGQVIDGLWRVERLTGEQVEVTYLPLDARLPLALAELSADRDGAAPSGRLAAQTSGADRPAIESRPMASEQAIAANGPARATSAPGIVGGAPMASASAGRAAGAPAAVSGASTAASSAPASKLGSEVPTSGSMPGPGNAERSGLAVADATARGIAGGAIPQGKLGDATPSGKLGVD